MVAITLVRSSTAALDGGKDRNVHVDTRVVERLPVQHGLPVVADQDRDDRGDHLEPSGIAIGSITW